MDGSGEDSTNKMQDFLETNKSLLQNNAVAVFLGFFAIFVITNLLILNVVIFSSQGKNSEENLLLQRMSAICPQSCMGKFSEFSASFQSNSTASAKEASSSAVPTKPTSTPSPTNSPTPTSTPSATPTPQSREYYIPLGQGYGADTNWAVVPGMGAKIILANYGKIEKVYFEATIRMPSGSQVATIRLFNASSGQSIANSDLTSSAGTATLLTSQAISLTDTKDENLYQVQLKTQLGATTYIDQARLRIVSR